MIAHLAGEPVEELLLPALASGAGAVLVLARVWVASHVPLRDIAERPVPGLGTSGPGRAEKSIGEPE
jgi:hypothetical protein